MCSVNGFATLMIARIAIFVALLFVLGGPFLLRPPAEQRAELPPGSTIVVVTPHVPQIQTEFAEAFNAWHQRVYKAPVRIDWRQPGGTSEIIKQLEAQYQAAAKSGLFDFTDPANPVCPPGTIAFDLMFGGGTFDHGRLKRGVTVSLGGVERRIPMSQPAGFSQEQLDGWFGENVLGSGQLYDPQQYWIGTAASGFGIVYSKDVLDRLGVPYPDSFEDLTDPRLMGWVVLADPRQSGSVATTLDSILSNYGWEKGWRILRESCANSRYYTNTAPRPPIDISQGEAAIGLAIDFYGRTQGQAVLSRGQDPATSRVGYVDPKGAVYIDADPASILRGGPNPALALRFIEFCLTDEAQVLWQFPATESARGKSNPLTEEGIQMGPRRNELRRMPIRRSVYERYMRYMIDQTDPFELASPTRPAGWRGALGIMMGAFGIDTQDDQRAAWRVLNAARADASFPRGRLAQMESLFYAWPETTLPDGTTLAFTPENIPALVAAWRDPAFRARAEIAYTQFFASNYRRVISLAREGDAPVAARDRQP